MKHFDKVPVLFFLFVISLLSNNLSAQNTFSKQVINTFAAYWKFLPQEKIYVHTDKPYYSAGEDIWFKAYLVNATTHQYNTKSNYVYVELLNSFDSIITRVKIKRDSLGFSGKIHLNAETQAGNFILRAYTSWMQNNDNDFFFTKQLRIGNAIDDRVICSLSAGKIINAKQTITVKFTDANSKPLTDKNINMSLIDGTKIRKQNMLFTTKTGEVVWTVPVDTTSIIKRLLKVNIKDNYFKYAKQFYLPALKEDVDVQFFPESGDLIADNLQIIAFKAINEKGLSVNVKAKVYDKSNNEVADFSTMYAGLGKFSLFADAGQKYYALVTTETGFQKKIDLPEVKPEGVIMNFLTSKGRIFYDIKNLLTDTTKQLQLMVHVRGNVLAIYKLNSFSGQLQQNTLPAGITSFSIIDTLGNVFCERLIFTNKKQPYNINIINNKKAYEKRDKVKLEISLNAADSSVLDGQYSISVTDNKLVQPDSLNELNIQTSLLLTSDIKGYVENINNYFVNDKISSTDKLDLLMLTQGWRRFDLKNRLLRKPEPQNYFMEVGQVITGKVLNIFNEPSVGCDIIMLSGYKNSIMMTKTDSTGNFLFEGIEFPDSTSILLKAQKRKSITDVEIIADKDQFPISKVFIPYRDLSESKLVTDYSKSAKDKYYYEGGMKVIGLEELTVTGNANANSNENPLYSSADYKITAKMLEDNPGLTILDYLQTVPGIAVNGDQISIRGANSNPLFIVNDFETENIDDIKYLSSTEVESIAIFKGVSATIFGSKGGNGAIAVTLKQGVKFQKMPPISLSVVKPLGFQKPSAFFCPKYDVDSVLKSTNPDLRTTVFWGDKLKIDQKGKIYVEFFTADMPHNYNFTLEGVSKNGIIVHETGIIYRKENLPYSFY